MSVDHIEVQAVLPADVVFERMILVRYKNYRGDVALRQIIPVKLWWGKTEYHPHEQWLLQVWDYERGAYRDYALQDILEFIK